MKTFLFVCFLTITSLSMANFLKAEAINENIKPSDVYLEVIRLEREIEILRQYMGKPKNLQANLKVKDAEPREVLFQALTLFSKAERLAFEHTARHARPPLSPEKSIKAYHVYQVVQAALERIYFVKRKLLIKETIQEPSYDPNKSPSDVFSAINQNNRQLNLMLKEAFSPSDVYEKVYEAITYSQKLLEKFPEAELPKPPPFVPKKYPKDVFKVLISCFEKTKKIMKSLNIKTLELVEYPPINDQTSPSEVYDIASLVLSEISYLYENFIKEANPKNDFYAGRKFPSDVFQQAVYLKSLLDKLESLILEDTKSFQSK